MEWVKNWLENYLQILYPSHILTQPLSTDFILKIFDSLWSTVLELPWILQFVMAVLACILFMAMTVFMYLKLIQKMFIVIFHCFIQWNSFYLWDGNESYSSTCLSWLTLAYEMSIGLFSLVTVYLQLIQVFAWHHICIPSHL